MQSISIYRYNICIIRLYAEDTIPWDSKHYLTSTTAGTVQYLVTVILLIEGLRIWDEHLSKSPQASLAYGDRIQWQWTAILSGRPNQFVSARNQDWTHILYVPSQVCFTD